MDNQSFTKPKNSGKIDLMFKSFFIKLEETFTSEQLESIIMGITTGLFIIIFLLIFEIIRQIIYFSGLQSVLMLIICFGFLMFFFTGVKVFLEYMEED